MSSSLAVARGLDLSLGGLFTAADLATASLLLQLSVGERDEAAWAADLLLHLSVGGGDEAAVGPSSRSNTTKVSSPRSVSTSAQEVAVDEEEEQHQEQKYKDEPVDWVLGLDRRPTKRYRLVPELYGATCPSIEAFRKMKRDDAGEVIIEPFRPLVFSVCS